MSERDNLLTIESNKKCEVLNSFVSEFKSRYPYMSTNQIAKKMGIPQATLNRIENNQTNPSLENILNILIATGNESKVAEILKAFFPSKKSQYDQIFSVNIDTPLLDKRSSEYATNEDTFIIMQLAFTRTGVRRCEIKDKFGTFGLKKLDKLLDEGILVEDADGVIKADQEKVNVSFSDLKDIILLAIKKCYDSDSGHLSYQTESVNQEGLDLIYQELKRTQVQIRKILYNQKYFGDQRVFIGLTGDKILKEDVAENLH